MGLAAHHYPVLVTGAAGLLGRALGPKLLGHAPGPDAVHLTDVADLDVTDAAAVADAVRAIRPRTVFHLAAWTDVDGAEAHPREAARLNAEAAENVAVAADQAGALIVHLSTDFIFDGTRPGRYVEDDPPSPQSVYGRTKADGEGRVRAAAPASHLVVRTAWLYGAGGRDFIDAILARARAGQPLRVVTDQVGCPTWSEDLAAALVAMVEAGARGTLHACGAGEASRWDLAVEALRAAGFDTVPERVLTADMPRPARRPARAILSTDRLAETVGFRFPPWQESVRAYVRSLEG
ncbi:MAG TPA: dTDP-4-dehydrorhamnose reductase [Phycisphaerae bacterium]|nr:dTDP-4-dehydrorhamnose reductase [Phycisphaerae bacterium]